MIRTKILYYLSPDGRNPFAKFLDSLDHKQQTKILRLIMYIEQYGLVSILPHTKKLSGTPLWEIRILGKDNIRTIYIVLNSDSVLILHGFIKKTQKTSLRDIKIAIDRYHDWLFSH